jgi:hypothetical protein
MKVWESFRTAECGHVCFEERILLIFFRQNLAQLQKIAL